MLQATVRPKAKIVCKKKNNNFHFFPYRNFIRRKSWFQQIKLQATLLLFDEITLSKMFYINTSKQELSDTKSYEQTSEKKKSVINNLIS